MINYDPAKPLQIEVSLDSPQTVSYNLWQKPPGGSWVLFAHGTDEEGVRVTTHRHQLDAVVSGTSVKYRLIFAGNPNTAIKAEVSFGQNNVVLTGGLCSELGMTDEDGVAVRSQELTFGA